MPAAPLRCHLLIGPPASGKTTLAGILVPLLQASGGPPPVLLSTDRIRAELFGDAAVQGPWLEIEAELHRRLQQAVAAGSPVIVDATHARRPWRLELTQALALPAPVEWIGWWLYTPLATCLEWNQRRSRLVPEPVIREMAAALADPHFGPCRAEGFAAVVAVVPTHHDGLNAAVIEDELSRLDTRIRAASNREAGVDLHGYSRLLDLERLLYLIRLLSQYPELSSADPASRAALEAIVSPLPQGDLADGAAAMLSRLHGRCFGDARALRADLHWLQQQGFCQTTTSTAPVEPPAGPPRGNGSVGGGVPPLGERPVFTRTLTLLRHLLQVPFDHQSGTPLAAHLIQQQQEIPGAYLPSESATLRKDLEKLLTPYGFRSRNANVRHGYALGTALLSAPRLREVHAVVRDAVVRLEDPTAQDLLSELEERLRWGGVAVERQPPVRAFANRSIISAELVRPDALANRQQAEQLETAIVERRRLVLERYRHASRFPDSPDGELRVWPLQLLFHNIGWYLVYELDAIGRPEGLIRSERLDRLALRHSESRNRRSEDEHARSLERLQRLLRACGGIYFGDDVTAQKELCSDSAAIRRRQLQTLRFSCQPWCFAFIREGLQRYPIEHSRFSRPLSGDQWWHHPKAPHVLAPNDASDSHPYPVELDLPVWTLQQDVDLRNWLFGFGAGIRIESPQALRQELVERAQQVLAIHQEPH
jgi:predicted kinase